MTKTLDIIKGKKSKHIAVDGDEQKEAHLTVHDYSHDNSSLSQKAALDIESASSNTQEYLDNFDPHQDTGTENSLNETSYKIPEISMHTSELTENLDENNLPDLQKVEAEPVLEETPKQEDIATMSFIRKKELLKKSDDAKKIVFMGTGLFAGEIIDRLVLNPHFKVVMIITQPDKKIGRKKSSIHRTFAPNPVRDAATKNGIVLYQPFIIDHDAEKEIQSVSPDILVVASYGRILPKYILDIPPMGAVNVHGSLLPLLRGASPIQNALMQGLDQTGVTIMMMDAGMDTGDILAQETVSFDKHDKADEIIKKVSIIGSQLLIKVLIRYINNDITPIPQDHSIATLCQLIDREDGHIQWTDSTMEIYNRYRALYPWPGIFSYWEATENQMLRIKLRSIYPVTDILTEEEQALMPGTVFIYKDQLCVKTFDSAIIIEAVQPECKAVMPIFDFLNGYKNFEGALLR